MQIPGFFSRIISYIFQMTRRSKRRPNESQLFNGRINWVRSLFVKNMLTLFNIITCLGFVYRIKLRRFSREMLTFLLDCIVQ